jgi:4-hydroxybenzoate polyprenyltransferase
LIIAAIDWAIAMHAYSAIPDIKADSEAGISTVATLL